VGETVKKIAVKSIERGGDQEGRLRKGGVRGQHFGLGKGTNAVKLQGLLLGKRLPKKKKQKQGVRGKSPLYPEKNEERNTLQGKGGR